MDNSQTNGKFISKLGGIPKLQNIMYCGDFHFLHQANIKHGIFLQFFKLFHFLIFLNKYKFRYFVFLTRESETVFANIFKHKPVLHFFVDMDQLIYYVFFCIITYLTICVCCCCVCCMFLGMFVSVYV